MQMNMAAAKKPKVLMVMDHTPDPVDRGEKFRTRRVLEALVQHFDVRVVCLEREGDSSIHALAKKIGFDVAWSRRVPRRQERALRMVGMLHSLPCRAFLLRSLGLQRAVSEAASEVDLVLLENPYAVDLHYRGAPVVNELHGIESEYYQTLAGTVSSPLRRLYYRWEHSKLVRHEHAVWNLGRANIFLSDYDRVAALKLGLDSAIPHCVVTQGVDFPAQAPAQSELASHLFFCGNLSQPRNTDPLIRFIELLREGLTAGELPADFKFRICGKGAPARLLALCDDRHFVHHGFVANLDPYLASTRVVFCYLPGGSGVKTKIVEAFGYGKGVLCDELSAKALPELFERSATPVAHSYEDAYALLRAMLDGRLTTGDLQLWVRESYSWVTLMRREIRFLRDIVDGPAVTATVRP
jgi:glycosyltransferase involved in cell wall biosynthesis